jgi:hypothetical protein
MLGLRITFCHHYKGFTLAASQMHSEDTNTQTDHNPENKGTAYLHIHTRDGHNYNFLVYLLAYFLMIRDLLDKV